MKKEERVRKKNAEWALKQKILRHGHAVPSPQNCATMDLRSHNDTKKGTAIRPDPQENGCALKQSIAEVPREH